MMANVSIIDQELFHIPNFRLLLFKYYLCVSRCSKTISFIALKTYIQKMYILSKNLYKYVERKKDFSSKSKVRIYF